MAWLPSLFYDGSFADLFWRGHSFSEQAWAGDGTTPPSVYIPKKAVWLQLRDIDFFIIIILLFFPKERNLRCLPKGE